MSSAERLAVERAIRQSQAGHQQAASLVGIFDAVITVLRGALDSDDATRAQAQETFRRNAQAQRGGIPRA